LPELLEAIIDVIEIPAFDPGELKVYAENKVERLQIELKKNEVLAYRHLTEVIFGKAHPYGKNLKKKDYLSITSEDLRYHHIHNVLPDRGMVFISGSLGGKEIESIQQTLGQWKPISPNGLSLPKMPEPRKKAVYREITAPQSHQASIRIGRKLFSQRHPDFNGLILLNTILGGYFGSRLMAEIRENKGLTYGIYSSIDSFAEDGCIYISTETATDNVEAVITAIKGEVQRLRTEPVSEAELDMARNYLMGHIMTQLDGPFASMDFIKSMKIERLDDSHFQQMIMTLQSLTAEDIRQLAEQYLNLEEWSTIVVK
jgi:predicted Zn-dependent peptidase